MERQFRKLSLAKSMLEARQMESFVDLMALVTITAMREALGNENHSTLTKKIRNPQKFTIEDLEDLATKLLDCDTQLLIDLALNEYRSKKQKGQ